MKPAGTGDSKAAIEQVLPQEDLRDFKGQYLETAKRLNAQHGGCRKDGERTGADDPLGQIGFGLYLTPSLRLAFEPSLSSRIRSLSPVWEPETYESFSYSRRFDPADPSLPAQGQV